jgi:bis(5'-nucleosidyl)-tetraphosphatase
VVIARAAGLARVRRWPDNGASGTRANPEQRDFITSAVGRDSQTADLEAQSKRRRRFSAGVVVVRAAGREWRFLLLRVYRTWDFPKGGVEDGETALEAAVREVTEETMLSDLRFRWGEDYCDTVPYSSGKVARYFLAESAGGPVSLPINAALGRPEHHEFRWVAHAEAKHLLPERLQPVLEWAQARVRHGE